MLYTTTTFARRNPDVVLSIALGLLLLLSVVIHDAVTKSSYPVCRQIERTTSRKTSVVYPGDLRGRYVADIFHWARSSSQHAKCSVRPVTPEDVGTILRIIGATRTPFAVKGGGHTSNPGFSSTTGIQISMKEFSEVTYDAESQTAVIGAGLAWDKVYAALAPYGVNVVGGRVKGVGVAGFLLGGGYSWLTNQRGLGVDNIVAYELVKPTGEIVTVSESSDPDLFFGLKGGLNNFGIVTRFVLKAYPQQDVWGGVITFTLGQVPDVTAATANFSALVTDPKASIITTYNYVLGQLGVALILFYDAPTPPTGIFDEFLSIPAFTKGVSTRSFLSLVKATPVNTIQGQRIIFDTIPLTQYTPMLLNTIVNETVFWGKRLSLKGGLVVSYDVEPFLPSIFTIGTDSSSPLALSNTTSTPITTSAYPPSRAIGLSPFIICYAWSFEIFDSVFHDAIRQSASRIRQAAASEEGQAIVGEAAVYPNYAHFDTPLEGLYGANLQRLRKLRHVVDPENVMGLAGGFRI